MPEGFPLLRFYQVYRRIKIVEMRILKILFYPFFKLAGEVMVSLKRRELTGRAQLIGLSASTRHGLPLLSA